MPFQGRTVQGVEKNNNSGLNENQSILAVGVGTAIDMDNFEVDLSGAVALRAGYTLQSTIAAPIRYMTVYFTTGGTEVWVAVAGTSFYEATSASGPWTDRTGGVTLSTTNGPWVGAELNGKFVLVNGVDPPVYHTQGATLQTLKVASTILPPENASVIVVGANDLSKNYTYAVTVITALGETTISNLAGVTGNSALTASTYNTISWNLRAGAQGYNIYKIPVVAGTQFQLLASVGRLTNSYNDTGAAQLAGGPPIVNTATNTPADWDNHPPVTVTVIARGRAQRMLMTQGSTAYASALSDCLDWETGNDAFNFPIRGGTDNVIRASVGLYDYTILFSNTNAYVHTGSTYNDFQQIKILNVGCNAPNSMVASGDEVYFWSDLGPNSLTRVQYGQDLATNEPFHLPVQKTVHKLSNKAQWSRIVAWKDVRNLRIGWAFPNGAGTSNSKAIIRGTVNHGWSKHSMPAIVSSAVDAQRNVYIACEDGNIYKLYDGFTDNGVTITGSYTTGWYDSQSNLNRYMESLSIIMDKAIGAYTMKVDLFWDFAITASSTHTLTDTTTDGVTVVDATPTGNIHNLYTKGMGKFFQIKFSVVSSTTGPRILGWREEMYAKGRR